MYARASLWFTGWPVLAFALVLLPASVRAQPATQSRFQQAWQNGTPATITGELTAVFADDFQRGTAELMHFIRDARTGRTFRVRYQGDPPRFQHGTIVTLLGRTSDSELYVLAAQTDGTAPLQTTAGTLNPPPSVVSGDQRTLVTLVNFSDMPLSCSYGDVEHTMFSDPGGLSVDALYRSTSFGRLSLSGTVAGPFTIAGKSTDTCDIGVWAGQANDLFAAAGGDATGYSRRVYVMPPNSCPAAGYGSLGGSPSYSWVFRCDLKGVFAHEFGHNIGMEHAATPTGEYGDTTDPMSFGSMALRGVNAAHRHQLGWFDPAMAQVLTAGGSYELAPLATPPGETSTPQMLVIPKPDSHEYYYLSYRHAVGFDSYVDGSYMDRLSIHRYAGDGSASRTYLLAALGDGQSFSDAVNGITLRLISHSASGATVSVDIVPVCTRGRPALSVTPASQSAVAGSALDYTVVVTNTDSSACAASTLDLSASAATGWSAAISPAALTLSPGASAQSGLTLTSAANAAPALYTSTVTLTGFDAVHASSASAVYSVVASCVPAAPLMTGSPVSQSARPGDALGYAITVTDRDSASCGSRTFQIQTALPIGWTATPANAPITLAAGTSQTLVLMVSSPSGALAGSYGVSVKAMPADGLVPAATMAATYVVEQWDTQPPTAPSGLTVTASQKQKRVILSWKSATDNDIVIGYQIVRNGVTVGTSTTTGWTDPAWSSGATYGYYVIALDAAHNLSPPSQTVAVTLGGGSSGGNGRNR